MLLVLFILVVVLVVSVSSHDDGEGVLLLRQRQQQNKLSLTTASVVSEESSSLYPTECNKEFYNYCTDRDTNIDDVYSCLINNYQELTVKCANSIDSFYSYNPNAITTKTDDTSSSTSSISMIYFIRSIFDNFFQPSYYLISYSSNGDGDGDDQSLLSPCDHMGDGYNDDGDDDLIAWIDSTINDDGSLFGDDDTTQDDDYDDDNDDDNDYDDDGNDDQSQLIENSRNNEGLYYFSKPFPYILYSFLTSPFVTTNSNTGISSTDIYSNSNTATATNIDTDTITDSNTIDEALTKGYQFDK